MQMTWRRFMKLVYRDMGLAIKKNIMIFLSNIEKDLRSKPQLQSNNPNADARMLRISKLGRRVQKEVNHSLSAKAGASSNPRLAFLTSC